MREILQKSSQISAELLRIIKAIYTGVSVSVVPIPRCLAIGTRVGVSISVVRISRPLPLVRISRRPRYPYYWVSISVQGLDIRTKERARYPYCTDKICTLSESQRGVSVTVLVRIPRPQCTVLYHVEVFLYDNYYYYKEYKPRIFTHLFGN